ncbi:MAG: 2-C-methyl-D-erythritol 4-phosphate cytidylyltransferase [Syntrophales bacterium]
MKTLAIIPAGGAGRRMGASVPKQYLPLAGIPVILHTLRAFQSALVIDEIYLVVPEGDIPEITSGIVAHYGLTKVSRVLAGGPERQDSVRNALAHVRDEHGIILVHDGVRPFVSGELIRRAVTAADQCGAATVGVPVRDTVKEVSPAGWVVKTVPREGLWLTQTPQAFQRPIIRAAYEKAGQEGFSGTDDASVVERMGVPVRMVPGESDNIKLTTPEDLLLGEVILRRFSQTKAD